MKGMSRFGLLLASSCVFVWSPLPAQQSFTPTIPGTVRILQTNWAGHNLHVIDPVKQEVVGVIEGLTKIYGVTHHPDLNLYFATNELDETVDVVSAETLEVIGKIQLESSPQGIAIMPDGSKLYVGIRTGLDVIDPATREILRHIPLGQGVHNVFVSPDGKHAVAGSGTLHVIDTQTDRVAWTLEGAASRQMEFDTNPDGSVKRLFMTQGGEHGFVVVDWEARDVVQKVVIPKLPLTQVDNDGIGGTPSHGLIRTPDGQTLWVASNPHNSVYAYSLPDLELQGRVKVGLRPMWLTVTPDSRYVYSANAGSQDVSVVERESMREVARIPVGQNPKRQYTAVHPE